MGFAILILLVPIICPMLYSLVESSERESPGRPGTLHSLASELGKCALATAVGAGLVAAGGLSIANPYLALTGIAGVIVSVGTLFWLAASALEGASRPI